MIGAGFGTSLGLHGISSYGSHTNSLKTTETHATDGQTVVVAPETAHPDSIKKTNQPERAEPTQEEHSKIKEETNKEKNSDTEETELSPEEQKRTLNLKNRDREVKTHEQAHMAAAGGYAQGGPSFSYETGPDGKRYAVGGSVSIDTSSVSGDLQATIQKARVVRQAALAPADPSGADRQIAARASQMEAKAQRELAQVDKKEVKEEKSPEKSEESEKTQASDDKQSSPSIEQHRPAKDHRAIQAYNAFTIPQNPSKAPISVNV